MIYGIRYIEWESKPCKSERELEGVIASLGGGVKGQYLSSLLAESTIAL